MFATLTAVSFGVNQPFAGLANMRNALRTDRNYFLVTTAQYDALTTTVTAAAGTGDVLSDPTLNFYMQGGQRITSVQRDVGTRNSVSYTRINMSANASQNSPQNTNNGPDGEFNIALRNTFSLTTTYQNAISGARSDFLITQTQFSSSTIALADILSAATRITSSQTISTITPSFVNINGVAYALSLIHI